MLEQWGMSEKITGCDLDNGRFPFNFDNEEDLNSVLSQAPFHQNFCMFVLVSWKPGIDDNYPSLVPFWVHLQGIPIYLCTHKNLEAIGNRLRKVDKIDAAKGKIRVELDSSKPLKFSRTLQAKNKEGVNININIKLHYEKLFKHCTTCGLMSHEVQDCGLKQGTGINQGTVRETFFDRVRLNSREDKRDAGSSATTGVINETTYRSNKEGLGSYSRVQRSSHSSRVNRHSNTGYNPYSTARKQDQDAGKERIWKETSRPRSVVTGFIEPKTRIINEECCSDSNVTFRPNSSPRIPEETTSEDLIPPYNALKIAALTEEENDNEEDDAADVDMEGSCQ